MKKINKKEIWCLDTTIARFIAPRVRYLSENHMGYPGCLKSDKEWIEILNKIARAFELYSSENEEESDAPEDPKIIYSIYGGDPDTYKKVMKYHEEYVEGIELFYKWWNYLGD